MIDTHCAKCGQACYEWWEITVAPVYVGVSGTSRFKFCGECYKKIKPYLKPETGKKPLCESCANARKREVGGVEVIECANHWNAGARTECGDYEREQTE